LVDREGLCTFTGVNTSLEQGLRDLGEHMSLLHPRARLAAVVQRVEDELQCDHGTLVVWWSVW
jgi:hypothetical protein